MSEQSTTTDMEVCLPPRIIWEPDGKEMILIAGGETVMGRDDGPEYAIPAHKVTLESFYIDRYPVTQAEYWRFVRETGHLVPCYHLDWVNTNEYNWDPDTRTPPADKLDHPVVLVSWEDAVAYGKWTRKRLPTEAEWERAARGNDGRRWPWGDQFIQGYCNTYGLGVGRTTAVYRFSPQGDSPEGVGDMVGNVWEWTSSLYWPYPYDPDDGREDLTAEGWRVLRGGSWFNDLSVANTTARLDGDFLFFTNVGFRCVVSAEDVRRALESGEA
jgi:formylglycine-generating enzyme required for sulfatase activity